MEAKIVEPKSPTTSSPFRDFWKTFSSNRMALVGLAMLVLILLVAVFAHRFARYDVTTSADITSSDIYLPPSAEHWFG
ncbi:MAG: hypothetical protein AB1649_31830, partial [Chloroflexota bacterium]